MVFIDTTIKRKKSGILVYDGINENVQSKQPLCSNIISIYRFKTYLIFVLIAILQTCRTLQRILYNIIPKRLLVQM